MVVQGQGRPNKVLEDEGKGGARASGGGPGEVNLAQNTVPRPRSFLVASKDASKPQHLPGPRCGHTLTALSSAPERPPDTLILIGKRLRFRSHSSPKAQVSTSRCLPLSLV